MVNIAFHEGKITPEEMNSARAILSRELAADPLPFRRASSVKLSADGAHSRAVRLRGRRELRREMKQAAEE